MKHETITDMPDGEARLFSHHVWRWSKDHDAWVETEYTKGQRPTAMEMQHFMCHKQRHISDVANAMRTKQDRIIEALQASLADKEAIIDRLGENQDALIKADPGVGGVYVRQSMEQMANSELLDKPGMRFNMHDDINVVWSRNARFKFRISGQVSLVKAQWFHSLDHSVRAESWWHVCAQVGLTEPLARLFYHHPENGQESAVAKARPVQRGPIIACQGDYID